MERRINIVSVRQVKRHSARARTRLASDLGEAIVASLVTVAGLPPSRLELEITETTLMANNEQAVRTLERRKATGVRVALDDFGTRYASRTYLAQLSIDRLKLDKSFVHRMPVDHQTAAIIRSVLQMGRDLGVVVIAEGIKPEQQLAMLDAMVCAQGQGNLLSTPVPAEAAIQVLQRPWGDRFSALAASHTENGDLHAA